jgi:hypothetical protein
MKASEIAAVCYAVNNAYRAAIGELTRITWGDLLPVDQESLIAGVKLAMKNTQTPEQQHNTWLDNKLADGWLFGKEEDLVGKKSPNMVPYIEISEIQKVKDHVFLAIVKSMKDIMTEDSVAPVIIQVGKLPVKYIGLRPEYTDGLYQTGLHWMKGETKMVEESIAEKMFKHTDQYVLGEVVEDPDGPQVEPEEDKENTEEAVQMAKDAINQMRAKRAVVDWVEVNFQGMKMDVNEKLVDLKQKATGFIDQYGLS